MSTGMTDIQAGFSQTMLDDFKALADEQYLGATPPVDNDYLEPVNIPVYNSGDASHCLIGTDGDWNNTTLNDGTWKHFYVPSGDYSGTIVTLTTDGTSGDRRSISLHDGLETHPASLATAEQADVKIRFNNASYWDIHRMSGLSYQNETDVEWFYGGASYNTIDKHNLKDYYYGIILRHNCNYNTIQNSYLDHMTHEGRLSDNVGIALAATDQGDGGGDGGIIIGTKIINNDIRNAGDGIQLVVSASSITDNISYEGAIIDSNNIWNDGDVYTNGDYNINGYDPNGEYQIGENAMDLKTGSRESSNPVLITNNMMWGYRSGDGTAGGSQTTGGGGAFPIHYSVYNTHINNNIIFDSLGNISISNSTGYGANSFGDSEINNNIFYDIAFVNPESVSEYPMYLYEGGNVNINNNSYVNINIVNSGYFMRYEDTKTPGTWNNNVVINADRTSGADGNQVDNTYLYNATDSFAGTNDHIYATDAEANMTDYSFQYERFTTSPKTKTLTGVISTASSPHYGVAGSDIT